METNVRPGDPKPSHDAAKAAVAEPKLTVLQARVLSAFQMYGAMYDKQLVDRVQDMERRAGFQKLTSPSGIRSRRAELCNANDERLLQLRRNWYVADNENDTPSASYCVQATDSLDEIRRIEREEMDESSVKQADEWARSHLRIEGFRSALWNSGRTAVVDGFNVTVWEIAK